MHYLDIHWKGYPHHRFPRIRVGPSRGTSIRSRSTHATASNSLRRPLKVDFERQRKKQGFDFRRRRARKSRSASSVVRNRRLASLRARQHIQVFGWDPEVASKADTLQAPPKPQRVQENGGSGLPRSPFDTATRTTIIDSHDGAGASSICKRKPVQRDNLYSLMHVAEVPVYWSKKEEPKPKKTSPASIRAPRLIGEYAHVGPLDSVSRRRTYRAPPQKVGKSRTYDSRIDPRTLLDRGRPTKSVPLIPSSTTRRTASRLSPDKGAQRSPELRRVLESMVAKSHKDPQSVTTSMKSIVQTLLSDSVSRTNSQKKALRKFTRELELYLQAAKTLPKQTLVPSPSATTVSAHTVEELKPYSSQFYAAGLAVTSADQRRKSEVMKKLKKGSVPPPTPPKDERYFRQSMTRHSEDKRQVVLHHHAKTSSLASYDTGTTVMDFTPPHEQTTPRPRAKRRSSSDHTVMAFTPPQEVRPLQPKSAPPPPPRASTKKSLPWLRQPETADVSPSHTPKTRAIMTASTMKTKPRNPSDILLSFSIPRDSVIEKFEAPRTKVTRREPDYETPEVRWKDMNFRDEINAKIAHLEKKIYNDVAIQVPEFSSEYALTDQGVKYVDAIAQTSLCDRGTLPVEEIVESRAPFIVTKSKTFPVRSDKCVGSCNQPPMGLVSALSSKKRYQDEAVQTDLVESTRDIKQPAKAESKRPSFKSIPTIPDLNGTFPFTSPSPFRRSLARRSPNKSVDEVESRGSPTTKDVRLPTETSSTGRKSSSLLLCAHCGAEIDISETEKLLEAENLEQLQIVPEFPLKSQHSSPRIRSSHACTARSSLECSQCAARVTCMPSAPREESSPVATGSQRSPSRKETEPAAYLTPDWAAKLESSLENIIQSYHSPEERLIQHEAIAETVAEFTQPPPVPDPRKKSSVPKLKLRPSPTNCPPLNQSHPAPASRASFLENVLAQSETATTCSSVMRDRSGVSDRVVFRGLHVATAAACDEDVAKWIDDIMGTGIRKFLADLSAFDGLGFNTLAGVARRAAKQRRGELKAWERLREKRTQENAVDEGWEDCGPDTVPEAKETECEECSECGAKEENRGRAKDKKMGFIAPDETVNLRAKQPLRERSAEEIVDGLAKVRERTRKETLKERAVRLGWRDGSVSGEV